MWDFGGVFTESPFTTVDAIAPAAELETVASGIAKGGRGREGPERNRERLAAIGLEQIRRGHRTGV